MKTSPNKIPATLYTAEATRNIDRIAIEDYRIPGYQLMSKAGEAVFDLMQQHYPLAKRILVCCGAGNNAGDGYVVARLARQAGLDVDVISMVDPGKLVGDAQQAYRDWKALGIHLRRFEPGLLDEQDLVIDALLGTGLQRPVAGDWAELIQHLNRHPVAVIAVDIPSGLNADTGQVMGVAVEATMTMTFIAMKQGLLTYQGKDVCGDLFFTDLDVPQVVYEKVASSARLLQWETLRSCLPPRRPDSHKGDFGHLLVVGGNNGMAGAARMAAEAALRSGAGRVSVATRPAHVGAIVTARPELMVWGVDDELPEALLHAADCIVIGPGLGQDTWASHLLGQVLQRRCAKVLDADALNLLSPEDGPRDDWVLTPHPGEAGRLLDCSSTQVQQDRFSAAARLQQTYGGSILLKGAGSIVQSGQDLPGVCMQGNPGMASAGMGDVLSGILGGLLAQGLALQQATELATLIHAMAGDRAAENGERGLLATDLYRPLRSLVNPLVSSEIENG